MTNASDPTDTTPEQPTTAAAAVQVDDAIPTEPRVIDEAAWAEANDDDEEEDDDGPHHFDAVASEDGTDNDEEGDDAAVPVDTRPDLEVTLNADAEIPLASIDEDALWVVKRLRAKGFEAYLTGGCVRDLLLGRQPKDFDVATAAHPNQVRAVFRNCRLVGRRFRLAHVFFQSGKVIETATFRANPTDTLEDLPEDLLVARDNVFGSVEEDARRRDLTINGLFYDPVAGKVLDFVNGRADLDARLIRTIGDPDIRFQEDPVRILRSIKFAARLGFAIEPATLAAMERHTSSLLRCAHARLQEELLRLLASTYARTSFELCEHMGVTRVLLPELLNDLTTSSSSPPEPASQASFSAAPTEAAPVAELAAAEGSSPTPSSSPSTEASPEGIEIAEALASPVVSLSTAADRRPRLFALLEALDEIRRRDADITSALAIAVLVTPVWETLCGTPGAFEAWWQTTAEAFTERLRLTRHDRERIPQLLQAQLDLAPQRRRGHHARATVSRPSFREALLLLIIRLQAAQQPLDEVAAWKVVAAAYAQPYQQARSDRNRQRAAGRGAGGDRGRGGRGRDRDRDRGDRRGRGNNGRRRGR
jgi:poly(A) polymerase